MARQIIWTKRANKKFNSIIKYLKTEWGERVTENFVRRTYDIVELIAKLPEIGTVEHREKDIKGFIITKHNRLFYRTTDKEIILLNFFDNRQNPKKRRIR